MACFLEIPLYDSGMFTVARDSLFLFVRLQVEVSCLPFPPLSPTSHLSLQSPLKERKHQLFFLLLWPLRRPPFTPRRDADRRGRKKVSTQQRLTQYNYCPVLLSAVAYKIVMRKVASKVSMLFSNMNENIICWFYGLNFVKF